MLTTTRWPLDIITQGWLLSWWLNIFRFCWRNPLLFPIGPGHSIHTVKNNITFLALGICNSSTFILSNMQKYATIRMPKVWLSITMGETQIFFLSTSHWLVQRVAQAYYLYPNTHDSGASAREARQRSTMGKKNSNPSSRENLVMTSAYERPYVRTSVQTRGEGEGRLEIFLTVTHTGN